jgi:7,8-dihydropterin-6-yl-methyl-4-(beta-D-ribofuranosyl)aminobenzene 5'-phosphate synthase
LRQLTSTIRSKRAITPAITNSARKVLPLNICITTLVENTTSVPGLRAEHGLSFWIEHGDRRLLFDAGQSDLLVQNARALNIDLAQADAIALSHGHYDHTGGLSTVLGMAPKARLYLHPAALEPKFGRSTSRARSIGMTASARQAVHDRQVVWTQSPTEILDGVSLTGQVPRVNNFEDVGGPFFLDEGCSQPDPLLDDQALIIESAKGLVVVFGCAHAGVVNTLQRISELRQNENFYAVMGGMHLIHAGPERIERTMITFQQYNPRRIGPAHCTGGKAVEVFRSVFPERCFDCSTGKRILF